MLLLFFSVVKYLKWRPRWQQQQGGESHGFTLHRIDNSLLFFVMVMFLSLFSKSFPFTHAPLSRPLLAGSDNTVISYYSHKCSYFWKAFLQKKNEVINARVCWTDGITKNFVTEFLIKVKTFFESICVQNQLNGWIKFTKNIYILLMECSVSTQKQPLSMLQTFVTILTAGWHRPSGPVQL